MDGEVMSEGTKPDLRIINSPEEFEARNYWNTVGIGKEFFPTEPRLDSIPIINKQGRVVQEPKDEWWINSKEHHYCFWSWIRANSEPDGTFEPQLQSDIARLFGCSSTKVHFMIKEAMDKLMTEENLKVLQDMLALTEDEPEDIVPGMEQVHRIDESDEDSDD